ncbi:Metal-tetracycline/H(+) antiporter [Serratia fonticola]|uniref:Metal-tetracycline/H(+) antiporter n=1 Tax=Serratia fonticola TaxID=47917 RepID=A0A4U9VKB5_SERFO|nr:Metal-tetracycline/H(+) antiporter [Serratia fonticola]
MAPAAEPINWQRNLFITWLGCFLTGAAFSLIMPFLPLYVEALGVTGHQSLNMWSGLVFSITFLFSAIASPFWGSLADRRGRKLMLLRSALGMGIVMVLMGMAQNIWQFLALRAVLGLLGGFIPNANALIATQVPRHRSGWALGTLSTGGVSGALIGPLIGGLLADQYGLRPVFFITATVLFICFLLTLFCVREQFTPVQKKDMLHARQVFASLKSPKLILSLFITTMIIQIATGSIAPILTLYVRETGRQHQQPGVCQRFDRLGTRRCRLDECATAGQAGRQDRPGADSGVYAGDFRAVADPNGLCPDTVATRRIALPARRCRWRTAACGANPADLQLYQSGCRANIQL